MISAFSDVYIRFVSCSYGYCDLLSASSDSERITIHQVSVLWWWVDHDSVGDWDTDCKGEQKPSHSPYIFCPKNYKVENDCMINTKKTLIEAKISIINCNLQCKNEHFLTKWTLYWVESYCVLSTLSKAYSTLLTVLICHDFFIVW